MKIKIILIVVVFLSIKINAQSNFSAPILEETITATQTMSYFGNSISMSNDGNTLAVGEYNYAGSSVNEKGRVQIFENQSGVWNQKGLDILGINDLFNAFGTKVELSSDGETIAIFDAQVSFTLNPGQTIEDLLGDDVIQYFQYVQVYRFQDGNWVQLGTDFTFDDVISYEDFSLSKDGNNITISANSGTKVYEFDGSNWNQVGQEIPELNPLFAELLSISEDGNIIAIADENYNDPNTTVDPSTEGQVRVYENVSGTWSQIGNSIVGSSDFQGLGKRIAISSNGNTIAIVSEEGGNDDSISVYELNGSTWSPKGTTITEGLNEIFDIKINADGTILAVGDSNGGRLFKFDTDWNQANSTTQEENGPDFRHSITMDNDGDVFAVGTPSINTGNNGFVNIYSKNPSINFLFNGSAEIGPIVGNGWTQLSGVWVQASGNTQVSPQDGNFIFYAGATPIAELYQEIDLSSNATLIDAGLKAYAFSGYTRSFNQSSNNDTAEIIVSYRDASNNELDSYTTGPTNNPTSWVQYTDTRLAPVGTRKVRITLISTRFVGSSNDGYFDNLILEEVSSNLVAIPDVNFEQALVDLGHDTDGLVNGSISVIDALNVNVLNIVSESISDLTGLSEFKNLEILFADNNNLSTIDISQNIELLALGLSNNQLTDIDISQNLQLGALNVDDNLLTNLDVTQNVALTQLSVNNNNISEIDVTNLNALETLSVSDNLLVDLMLSQNPNLQSVDISNNQLTSVIFRNGNNSAIITENFIATNNPNLNCISVNDILYATENWTNIDPQTSFVFDCFASNPNNLLYNGSAEIIPIMANEWTQITGNTTTLLNAAGALDGVRYFYANQSSLTEFYQEIDLSGSATEIDSGSKSYTFSFNVRSFNQGNADAGRALVEYKDASNNVLDTFDSGYIVSVDVWSFIEDTRLAPIGTRSVRVTIFQQRNAGLNNDGYIDDIVFQESPAVVIPDSNFEQALIDLGIDTDGVINQQVFQNDIAGVSILDVSGLNISDLTGIESFLSLEILDASNNNLSTVNFTQNSTLLLLDVSDNQISTIDLSGNLNLGVVRLNNNALSNLDVSTNVLLSEVSLDGNQLSVIDLSSLPLLERLSLNNNTVVELDLSQNSVLLELFASNNNLVNLNIQNTNNLNIGTSHFDVTGNSNLYCIQVDDITFSTNNWPNIDAQSFFGLDCAPDNDGCADAQSLDLGILTAGTTQSGTSSGIVAGCQESDIVLIDVWYEFNAPSSGSIAIFATSPTNQVKIALYENCGDTTPIACDEGGIVVENLTSDQLYYVQVWVEGGAGGRSENTIVGDFEIEAIDAETLSVNDTDFSEGISIYPNPAKAIVHIKNTSLIDDVRIIDYSGRIIKYLTNLNSAEVALDISDLASGIYLVNITQGNNADTKKLIIK